MKVRPQVQRIVGLTGTPSSNGLMDLWAQFRLLDISDIISQVRNESYRLILEKRYLCFLPWDQIATDLNISRRWVLIQHDRAVAVVDRLIAKQSAS